MILAVFDSTSELEPKDFEIIEKLKNKNCIAVINKIDGKTNIDKDFIYSNFKNTVEISAKMMRESKDCKRFLKICFYMTSLKQVMVL